MTGGDGTTNFTYVPVGSPGALERQSEIGPGGTPNTLVDAYDALGRVANQTVAGQPESFAYDGIGRITADRNALGGFTQSYFGETGQLTNQTLAGSNLSATYSYEPNTGDRRLKSILHNVLHLAYTTDDENNVLTQTGTRVDDAYVYDAANRLVKVKRPHRCDDDGSDHSGWGGSSRDCDRDQGQQSSSQSQSSVIGGGRRFARSTVRQSGSTVRQTEDGRGGRRSAHAAYTYDASDNLLVATGAGAFTAKATNANQLTQVTNKGVTATWTYDKDGNLLADGTRAYTWDAENRLLSVTLNATKQTSTFAYDPLGLRVAITDNGTTTRYRWCGGRICAAHNTAGAITARYFPQGEIDGTASRYYATDRLGSVRALMDNAGRTKGTAVYGAYGRTTITGEAPTFAYAGMFYHKASGLYLTRYRAYNPDAGRWISRDPIGEIAGMNLYAYAGDNPASF
ncbi:MAG: RHS repeat-associated core domain-containing protein, partial [Candidatus Dormibacteria bacterium]